MRTQIMSENCLQIKECVCNVCEVNYGVNGVNIRLIETLSSL